MKESLKKNKGIVALVLLLGIVGVVFAATQTEYLSMADDEDMPEHSDDAMESEEDAMDSQGDAMESEEDAMDSTEAMENDSMDSDSMNDSMEQ